MPEGENLRLELETRPNGGSDGGEKGDDERGHVAADRISLGAQLQRVQVPDFWQAQHRSLSEPVSSAGVWRADGEELYYLAPDGTLMAASITTLGGELVVGTPVALFPTRIAASGRSGSSSPW